MKFPFDGDLRRWIIQSACDAVWRSPLDLKPFPHFVVDGFLPHNVYVELHRIFPPFELFSPVANERHYNADGRPTRYRFRMLNRVLDQLAPWQRVFWYSVRSALSSLELRETVFRKLAPAMAYRYEIDEDRAAFRPGYAVSELVFETNGYRIAPHPDTRKKVVTMQIALPENDSIAHLGTEFYERSYNPLAWTREPHGFDVVRRMPFLPNTAYAFTVLNTLSLTSWHGRSTINCPPMGRKTLSHVWYEQAEHMDVDARLEYDALYGRMPIAV